MQAPTDDLSIMLIHFAAARVAASEQLAAETSAKATAEADPAGFTDFMLGRLRELAECTGLVLPDSAMQHLLNPQHYWRLCGHCRQLSNCVRDEAAVPWGVAPHPDGAIPPNATTVFCGSCRALLSQLADSQCGCGRPRFIGACGEVAPLCRACAHAAPKRPRSHRGSRGSRGQRR